MSQTVLWLEALLNHSLHSAILAMIIQSETSEIFLTERDGRQPTSAFAFGARVLPLTNAAAASTQLSTCLYSCNCLVARGDAESLLA